MINFAHLKKIKSSSVVNTTAVWYGYVYRKQQESIITTVNREIFAGLNFRNFCGFSEELKSLPHESFALSTTHKCSGLAP